MLVGYSEGDVTGRLTTEPENPIAVVPQHVNDECVSVKKEGRPQLPLTVGDGPGGFGRRVLARIAIEVPQPALGELDGFRAWLILQLPPAQPLLSTFQILKLGKRRLSQQPINGPGALRQSVSETAGGQGLDDPPDPCLVAHYPRLGGGTTT